MAGAEDALEDFSAKVNSGWQKYVEVLDAGDSKEADEMYMIGQMPMPADLRYRDVLLNGKPSHDRNDPFLLRHPRMPAGKRDIL